MIDNVSFFSFSVLHSNFGDYLQLFCRCMLMILDKIAMVLSLAYVMVDIQMI